MRPGLWSALRSSRSRRCSWLELRLRLLRLCLHLRLRLRLLHLLLEQPLSLPQLQRPQQALLQQALPQHSARA